MSSAPSIRPPDTARASAPRAARRISVALLVQLLALSGALAASSSAAAIVLSPAFGSPYATGGEGEMLETVDLNRDGRSDVVLATKGGARVMLASPLGQLAPVLGSPFSAPESSWIADADVNGDGITDLLSASVSANDASVLLGTGSGAFTPTFESPFEVESQTNPTSVAVADFNGDGHPDLAFADCGAPCHGSGEPRVSIYLGDGSGHFTPAAGSPFAVGLERTSTIVAADFNRDGRQDVAVAGKGQVAVLLGNGEGALAPALESPFATGSAEATSDIAAADLNGDGDLDVVSANSKEHTVSVMLGNGHGGLNADSSPLPTGSTGAASSVAIADMDANGTPDVVVTNEKDDPESGDVSVLLGNGRGGLVPAEGSPFSSGGEASFGRVGDFNGDGQPDVAIANGDDRSVSVLLNRDQPAVTSSSASLAFPRLGVGQSSPSQTLTFTNTGTGFLRPGGAAIVGSEAGEFTITGDGCAGLVMIVGQSCAIGVSFHPAAGGTRSASLEVPSDAPSGTSVIGLAGTGLAVPSLSSVLMRPSRFAVRRAGHSYSARGPHHGSTLLLTLSETATVRIALTKMTSGHRRKGKCHAAGHGPRCQISTRHGHLNIRLRPGLNKVAFSGVIDGHALPPGLYTATVTAINDESLSSTSVKVHFRIVH
jgi:hypothetical protein